MASIGPSIGPSRDPSATFVFDIETDRLLNASRDNWGELLMTVAVGIDGAGARHDFVLLPEQLPSERQEVLGALCARLDDAQVIVAYNGRGFDFRVLLRYYGGARVAKWLDRLCDPFEVVRETTGSWVKLDELLAANGLPRKSADGVRAVEWWAAGEHGRVLEYCHEDTRGLYDLVTRHATLRFPLKRRTGDTGKQVVVGMRRLDWARFLDNRGVAWLCAE